MKKLAILSAVPLLMVCGSPVMGTTLNVTSNVRVQSDYAGDLGTFDLVVAAPASGGAEKAYLRFDTSSLVGTVSAATLNLVCKSSAANINGYAPYDVLVYGLNDGVSGETTWLPSGTSHTTWATAPGNDTTSPYAFLPDQTTLLGGFAVPVGSAGVTFSLSTPALVSFLNASTNGQVTLMMAGTVADGALTPATGGLAFYNATVTPAKGATLNVTTTTPEPTALVLLLTGLVSLLCYTWRKRK